MNAFQEFLDHELGKVLFDEDVIESEDNTALRLAQQIISARNEKHLSQTALSRLTGIQQASLSKIENGEGNPSLQTLQRIAKGLGKKIIIVLE